MSQPHIAPAVVVKRVTDDTVLQRCLDIRKTVFVVEQEVPIELELDEYDTLDADCVHFIASPVDDDGLDAAVGTARMTRTAEGQGKAQRVAVLQDARGTGVGRALMHAIHEHARQQGLAEVVLGAQMSAIPFYERLHYEAYGPIFDDAGIDHRMMRLAL